MTDTSKPIHVPHIWPFGLAMAIGYTMIGCALLTDTVAAADHGAPGLLGFIGTILNLGVGIAAVVELADLRTRLGKLALIVAVLLVAGPAHAASPHATGTVQVQVFEQDTASGVQSLGTAVGLRRSFRRHIRLAPDPRLIPGAKMAVRGSWAPQTRDLIADPADPGVRLLRPPYVTPALPVERMIVLPVYFPGQLEPSRTPAAMLTDFARLQTWITRASYGRTQLVVEIRPWQVADRTLAETACDFGAMTAMAVRLHDNDVDFRQYTLVNTVTPRIDWQQYNCLGHGGAGGALIGRWPLETQDGWVTVGQQITGDGWPASAHETGHCFGLQHANSLDCDPAGVPPDIGPCQSREYGDLFDIMGSGLGDYSAARKQQLGWLDPSGPEQTLRVTQPGTYVLTPLGVPGTPGSIDVKGLQLPRAGAPPSTWLWLETRSPSGNDWWYPDDWLAGIFLHGDLTHLRTTDRDPDSEHFGDLVPIPPGAMLQFFPHAGELWPDVALQVGQSFVDPPWRVTVVSRTRASTVVRIDLATAPTPHPGATITPTGGNGGLPNPTPMPSGCRINYCCPAKYVCPTATP